MPNPYDAVLFDFDGVLADTEPLHYACWTEILDPFGIRIDWETYAREFVGISDRLMIARLAAHREPPLPFETLWELYPHKRDIFRERLMKDPNAFAPETRDLVRTLAGLGIPLAVVSSSGRNEVEPPLVNAGLGAYFETMVCGHEAAHLKPAPDPYLKAAAMLDAKHPLVVEDSDAGVASGMAAGFDVLRLATPQELSERVLERLSLPRGLKAESSADQVQPHS